MVTLDLLHTDRIFVTKCAVHLAVRKQVCRHVQKESGQGIEGELCALSSFRTISVTCRGVSMWPFTKENICLCLIYPQCFKDK